jgi:Domain of unknown function (DUF4091)
MRIDNSEMLRKFLVRGVFMLLLVFGFSQMQCFAQLPFSIARLGMAPSLVRIAKTDSQQFPTSIQIYAARRESESFQVIIQAPPKGLTNVNVSASDLVSAQGQILSKQNLTLYREHYVEVKQGTPTSWGDRNPPRSPGWYPDGLIPLIDPATQKPPNTQGITDSNLIASSFTIQERSNQLIWVDVNVPANAVPGDYNGKITVTSDQGKLEGSIAIRVWNFTLPTQPALSSSFEVWTAKSEQTSKELLKHRLMPKDVSGNLSTLQSQGLSTAHLGYWSGADVNSCKMKPAPSVEELRSAVSKFNSQLNLYNQTADEVDACPGLYPTLKQWARNLHAVGVKNLVTMMPNPNLYDDGLGRSGVDIWVVLPKMYDEARGAVQQVLKKGDQVWSYNALSQDSYSPKWEIDFAPINFRIQPGFINQSLGLTGLLYWRVDLWTQDPWHDIQTYSQGASRNFPGEGMLVYPGAPIGVQGVVPSMRLKWLRDGVDDYDYVTILKGLGHESGALAQVRQAGASWKSWTKEARVVELVRQRLGEEIDRQYSKR